MTHQIDAGVDTVKTTGFQSSLDLAPSDFSLDQLPACHDAKLPRPDGGNNPIRKAMAGSNTHTVVNPATVDIAPSPLSGEGN